MTYLMTEKEKENLEKVPVLHNINTLINQYDAYLLDLWGVVHNGIEAYPGVVNCLNQLIKEKKADFIYF